MQVKDISKTINASHGYLSVLAIGLKSFKINDDLIEIKRVPKTNKRVDNNG